MATTPARLAAIITSIPSATGSYITTAHGAARHASAAAAVARSTFALVSRHATHNRVGFGEQPCLHRWGIILCLLVGLRHEVVHVLS